MAIHFFEEDIKFNLSDKIKIRQLLKQLAEAEAYRIGELNYIFCSDEYLHTINLEHLQHDTYTDIITFDNSDEDGLIEGDIFISIDRVRDNAKAQKENFSNELVRVLCHGLFHLCGIKDKLEGDVKIMRSKEDGAILTFNSLKSSTVPRGTVDKI